MVTSDTEKSCDNATTLTKPSSFASDMMRSRRSLVRALMCAPLFSGEE